MAVSLKAYKAKIDEFRFQLVENWCLCKWCQLFKPDCENFAYWIKELKNCIDNLKFLDIKNGIDKRKILTQMLINDYDYDSTDMIERIIRCECGKNQKIRICKEFADNINSLIDAISSNEIDSSEYILKTFNVKL